MIKNIGFAITGSFCTHEKILGVLKNLVTKEYNITPIITPSVATTDTRFGKAADFVSALTEITGKKPLTTIVEAEPIGPSKMFDALVIAPCTGNSLSKIAHGISDNAVTMAAKSHMRNNKSVIIAVSSNDSLGLNLYNIAILMNSKNVYFVPFGQDNATAKPKSLVADYSLIEATISAAYNRNEQLQPVLLAPLG